MSAFPRQAPGDRLRSLLRSLIFSSLSLLLVTLIFSFVMTLEGRLDQRLVLILAYALCDFALLFESWLFLTAFDDRDFSALGLNFHPGWIKELLGGVGFGAAMMGAVTGTMYFAHLAEYRSIAPHPGAFVAPFAATVIFLIFAAALEEIGFRGYAFQRLVDATGVLGAVAITAFLFGLGHIRNPAATPLSTANTVLAGVIMAFGYLRARRLWFPIGLHFAWNFVLGPLASLPVSGIRLQPALFVVRLSGPAWLTGGDYGPEGSVILTVVCLGGIIWLAHGAGFAPSRAAQDVVK